MFNLTLVEDFEESVKGRLHGLASKWFYCLLTMCWCYICGNLIGYIVLYGHWNLCGCLHWIEDLVYLCLVIAFHRRGLFPQLPCSVLSSCTLLFLQLISTSNDVDCLDYISILPLLKFVLMWFYYMAVQICGHHWWIGLLVLIDCFHSCLCCIVLLFIIEIAAFVMISVWCFVVTHFFLMMTIVTFRDERFTFLSWVQITYDLGRNEFGMFWCPETWLIKHQWQLLQLFPSFGFKIHNYWLWEWIKEHSVQYQAFGYIFPRCS